MCPFSETTPLSQQKFYEIIPQHQKPQEQETFEENSEMITCQTSFDQIRSFIDTYDPPFDLPMKEGQRIAPRYRPLGKVFRKEQAIPTPNSKIGCENQKFQAGRKTYEKSRKSKIHNLVFPEELANNITFNGITFQLRQVIDVPNNTH